jgi:heavy metal sensor kinase
VKRVSIGARLTMWYAAAFGVGLLVLGVAMWFAVQQSLYHAIDESLRDRVEGIHRFIEDHKTRLSLDEVKEEFHAHGELFQVVDDAGNIIHRAETLNSVSLPPLHASVKDARFGNVAAADGPLRFLSEKVTIDGRPFSIQVAAPLRDLRQGLRDALWVLLPLFPVVLVVASAGGYLMSRRALVPVDRITQTARSITADNLAQRLAVPSTGDEIERLSHTLNEMFARIESAFARITRFTADASHELRTPLAVMRTTAEVALRGPPSAAEQRAALEYIIGEIERTSILVENLLLLTKADSGVELRKLPVDIVAALREACAQADVLALAKRLRLEMRLPDEVLSVVGDRDALRRLFLIVLDNAVKYAPAGGTVTVSLRQVDGHVVAAVRDTGIGISAEDLPFVFDRFYRVDRARSRAQGGAGLGLAIARWIAQAHGGTIRVESELNVGSIFTVEVPLV